MKVLLATDGSKYAEEAAWLLAHLPHSERLDLTVLSVIFTPDVHGTIETRAWMSRRVEADKAQAKRDYEKIEEMFQGANVNLVHAVVEGHAAETIVNEAETRRPDLVVLGARGHSTIDRLLLGSVSDFVATHAPCSVLIVRPTGLRQEVHRMLNICFAYDDSKPSNTAIWQLADFGWGKKTNIDVVTAVSFLNVYTSEVPIQINVAEVKDSLEEHARNAAEVLRKLSPNVHAFVRETDHIGEGLVQFSQKRNSDLIVMGDTGRGMLARFLLGSVSRYVLRHAHCSVWIARQRAADS
ncbi:MAG: universal stress protein [Planctomycetales bacterium]|nr:universal stress protein [Planctomycetales bacterium]